MESCILLNFQKPNLLPPSQRARIKDPTHWSSALRHHVKLKNDRAVLKSFVEMEASGVFPSRDQLPVVLKACARLQDLELGKRIHAGVVESGLINDLKVSTALIDMYCKCGLVDVARELFDEMGKRDLVSWNAVICGFVENSRNLDALFLFRRMRRDGLKPNSVSLVSLISACREMNELRLGQELHCYCLRNWFFDSEVHVGTALIDFYSCFDARASRLVFDSMEIRNEVSWNALLYAYICSGDFVEAMYLFVDMLVDGTVPDFVTFLAILESCGELDDLECGKQVHQLTTKLGIFSKNFVSNALIVMYGKCGDVVSSHQVFEKTVSADIASWNAMLTSYRNYACFSEAFDLFKQMQRENLEVNTITLATMLSICGQSSNLLKGKELHAYALKTGNDKDLGLQSALLSMYVESNSLKCACTLFNNTERSDLVSCNTLLKAMMENGYSFQAWELFRKMQHSENMPNSFTMISLLAGCLGQSSVNLVKSVHCFSIRHQFDLNPLLRTTLSDMYMRCGHETSALNLFWRTCDRDTVSWNAVIASYCHTGDPHKALSFFYQMQSEVNPNLTTMIIALISCARIANMPKGRCLHAYIIRRNMNMDPDIALGNALLTMYAKCGSLKDAENIFVYLPKKDIISWNAMIAAYGMHGRGNDALNLFYQMRKAGEKPTNVTFISLLSTCSHSGMLDEGLELFNGMNDDYGIKPEITHYGCMVDLFGRAGFIGSSFELIRSMPMEPDASVWRALLSACQMLSDIQMTVFVAKKLIEVEPLNTGNYIMLSNIYAAAGKWDDVRELRKQVKKMGLQKTPGSSCLAVRDQTISFNAGEISHPLIYEKQIMLLDDLVKSWIIS
ncbi:Pentatricopeptide repeat-containing protein [Apostasia shenzhenica]|uniref:Pentatricopeptide repeat-containing protein n=1 Tax=Apostasia shenzhenica TaxID=1088818 RepID=A0A2I0AWL5_9ASPA|nr:Pentatricopeptide repeat-containing protein [Apostasia shenzhenica]